MTADGVVNPLASNACIVCYIKSLFGHIKRTFDFGINIGICSASAICTFILFVVVAFDLNGNNDSVDEMYSVSVWNN